MDNVSTKELKEVRINVKISPKLRTDFHTAARLRGATMSALLHQFVVKTVREEKEREPGAFIPMPTGRKTAETNQTYLFSEGIGSGKSKGRSRKIKKDEQDIKGRVRAASKKKKR
jgi:hypothetical protein